MWDCFGGLDIWWIFFSGSAYRGYLVRAVEDLVAGVWKSLQLLLSTVWLEKDGKKKRYSKAEWIGNMKNWLRRYVTELVTSLWWLSDPAAPDSRAL